MAPPQLGGIKSKASKRSRPKAFDEYIGTCSQSVERGIVSRHFKIQYKFAFTGIDCFMKNGIPGFVPRPQYFHAVTRRGDYFDDVCTHVRKQERRNRARQIMRQIKYLNAAEKSVEYRHDAS